MIVVRENTEGLHRGISYIDGAYHVNMRVFTKQGMQREKKELLEEMKRVQASLNKAGG